jgi:hypothetical protein
MFRKVSIRMGNHENSDRGQNVRNPIFTNERGVDFSVRRGKKSDALKEVWVKNAGRSNMIPFLTETSSSTCLNFRKKRTATRRGFTSDRH